MIRISEIAEHAVIEFADAFLRDVVREIKDKEKVDIAELLERLRHTSFPTIELMTKKKTTSEHKEDPEKACEFIYSTNYNSSKLGNLFMKGDRCTTNALSGKSFCKTHKGAKLKQECEIQISTDDIQEYYPDQDKELTKLFDSDLFDSDIFYSIYVDSKGIIVVKNSDAASPIRWFLASKSKSNQEGRRILTKFSEKVINELKIAKIEHNYNYEVNPELYKDIKKNYENYLDEE
ncbi:hypothetical protein CONCODRAFT_72661 [Conidiobolus coronatus NRRL 28638]|uniref:Uncharacterized protein n=1 Tax=Conidiobolus coronatus (strain ATCC 28846 / CBS 209.66 / NRRL 28638) TaxID=796925 RepID=A0A137NYS3_CONC2|nr:hypothetical protein CONCODRAFT_72661 [Conidiobolus coronatus NRRL 28638]|eukprot:KXN67828.1 hypothetical protein CONCODRAFT_72661 [Conidiobolus coronatus NRRL 28638]